MKFSLKHLIFRLMTLACVLAGSVPTTIHAVNLVQEFYLPMPEWQVLQGMETASPSITDTNFAMITSILVTGNGTVIYYDQWEDGYETNLANPTQPTTQVWGDGDDSNGICPGFTHDPVGIPAGTVITLSNAVPCKPRNPAQLYYDGGDRIAATKALVVTRAGWPSPTGPIDGGAVVVLSTLDYGTNFVSPIGEDMPENLFKYVAFYVMASQDNTTVTIDLDGAGPTPPFTITLNQGQSYIVNGGVKKGGTITASKPVEVDLACSDTVNQYAYDWFTLYPQSEWSSSYYTPVPSVVGGGTLYTTINYFYNTTANPITILYSNVVSSGTFTIPANGGAEYPMPTNSGASFTSAGGELFTVLTTVAADPTNDPTSGDDTAYNWGYTPLPKGSLTTEADVGWAPGSSDYTVNGSPVWVTPVANTTIYVAYHGTNTPLTDPFGGAYSTNFVLTALQSKPIYVPGTNSQTGMRVYTLDNTLISVAWGEDPSVAPAVNPGLDLGTSVLPFPIPRVIKSAVIITDVPPAGLSVGDTIQYTVQTDNKGLLPLGNTVIIDAPSASLKYVTNSTTLDGVPIPDTTNGFPLSTPGYTIPIILSQGTSVFTYEATVVGAGGVSNTVNIGGTSIIVTNQLPPGYGSNAPAVSVFKSVMSPLSGTAGVGQTVQFNLQVVDNGNTILTNLSLVDNYPSNVFSFVSASVPINTTNAGKLAWTNLGSFYPGQSTNISVFLLATNASALATNSMTATSLNAATNTGITTIIIAGLPTPGITASKTLLSPMNGLASVGQTVEYNLQVVNSGYTTLTNILLVDNYPRTNFSFVTASILPNTNSAGKLTWTNIGTFTPGQFTNIAVSFTVTNYAATLTNIMVASSTSGATNSAVLTITRGGLTITKTVLSPTNNATVNIGSNVVFRILIKNTGQVAIRTLPLEDTYSASDFQYVSATIAPSSIGAGDLYWTNLTSGSALATNAVITNDVTMEVVGGATPALNTAFANYAIDTNGDAVAPSSGSIGVNTGAGQITGTVYNDINDSGIFTNGDTPLQNVTLTLYTNPGGNGVPGAFVQSVTTDANGNYQLLNLNTGAYVVVETLLPGYVGSAPPNDSISINLTALVTNANNNFFQYQLPVTNYSSINGTVWNDLTGSGVYQAGDFGISNVEVDLVQDLNSNGVADAGEPIVQNVFTATNGAYSFGGVVPGYYVIRQDVPSNYVSTSASQIGMDLASGVTTNGNNFFDYYVGAPNTNTEPVAVPDFTNTLENVAVTILAVANDISPGGLPLTITNVAATNGTAVIQYGTNVLFTPAANFTGTATIGYTITNGNGGKATSLITITVMPVADVGVSKAGPATVFAGTNFSYTISVTNIGPASASNVVASDVLPTNVVYVSASAGGTTNAGVVSWTLETMALHATTNLTLTVTAPAGGTITNSATVTSSTTDTNSVNNTSPPVGTTVTPVADLGVGKAGPGAVFAGTNFSYEIWVTNLGPSVAAGVVVTDSLPAGVVFDGASGNWATNGVGLVTWSLGSLTNGQVTNVTVTVIAPAGGTLTNTATVSSPTGDPNLTNNTSAPVGTTVVPVLAIADIGVAKTGPAYVFPGTNFSYTITVTNAGPSTAGGVVVTDTLPAGETFVLASGGGVNNGGVVSWTLGNMSAGQTSNLTLTVRAPAGGTLTNTATVSSRTFDPDLTNNTSLPVTTTATNVADISVAVYGPTNVTVGDGFFYTIVVSNGGPSTAVNTLVTNVLPTNLVFASASDGGVFSNGIVTWPVIPTLTNGQATNLILTVASVPGISTNYYPTNTSPYNFVETNLTPTVGILTNRASAFAATFDPNTNNNTASATYPNAQVQTVISNGVFSIFIATNTYPTTGLSGIVTNRIKLTGTNNLFIVGTSAFNPQTGLYEEFVSVTNCGYAVVHALRLYVSGPGGGPLRSGVTLENATGMTTNGVPYVEYDPPYNSTLYPPLYPYPNPTNHVTFSLEFFVSDYLPFTESLSAVAILAPAQVLPAGTPVTITNFFSDVRVPGDTRYVIQFNSIPGQTYTIEYSDDLMTWNVAVPSVVASAAVTQWYDDGPPETLSKPMPPATTRFYRVILDP
jgi:uncharacterized repeat protein (TIGR01451 family)